MAPAQARDKARRHARNPFEWIARVLGNVYVRLVLSIAIIASLLPFEWVDRVNWLFFAVFGLEFSLRATLLFRVESALIYASRTDLPAPRSEGEGVWRLPKPSLALLFVFDLLALLSFLPIRVEGDATRWLRIFRLSRMLLLLGYWAPLVRDVSRVLTRGDRAKQISLMGFVVLVLSFAGAVVIEHIGHERGVVDFDGDGRVTSGDERFFVHLWWAFRQIQDPGNMLSSPGEAAVVAVSLALTVVGLFMVSFLIGLGTDVVRELLELARLRPPGFQGHTIVVNVDASTQGLLHMLMGYSKKLRPTERFSLRWSWIRELVANTTQRGLGGARFVIAGESHDPPHFLRQHDLVGMVYRHASVGDETFLARTDTIAAQRVVLLADLRASDPDAETIQALLTITQSLTAADADKLPSGRKRLLIAEVLDESNVPAAHRAIDEGSAELGDDQVRMRAFVVPTERLIALFIACVTRRPGCEELLDELLTSRGHELYTCFFTEKGLGSSMRERPSLPSSPAAIVAELRAHARRAEQGGRVIPVGVFMGGPTQSSDACRLDINPQADPAAEPDEARVQTCAGFLAIASKFDHVWQLAGQLGPPVSARAAGEPPPGLPEFARVEPTALGRVLICGFRSATVGMIEALIKAQASTQILVMVEDEAARAQAFDDFEAHSKLIERGLLVGEHGRFLRVAHQPVLHWVDPEQDQEPGKHPRTCGHVQIEIGDWSSSRRLSSLPEPFERVDKLDAVILISGEDAGSDARTAKTLMKLETLVPTGGPRVVAEVLDVGFAHRLRQRYERRARVSPGSRGVGCRPRALVYSIQELRAYFMFQAVVVPHFDRIYAELMSPWGQSFVELAAHGGQGTIGFDALADHFAAQGQLLLAVELGPECGATTLHVAEGGPSTDTIELAQLRGAWVIAAEPREAAHSVIG